MGWANYGKLASPTTHTFVDVHFSQPETCQDDVPGGQRASAEQVEEKRSGYVRQLPHHTPAKHEEAHPAVLSRTFCGEDMEPGQEDI